MGIMGLEPIRPNGQRILSPLCLPFQHIPLHPVLFYVLAEHCITCIVVYFLAYSSLFIGSQIPNKILTFILISSSLLECVVVASTTLPLLLGSFYVSHENLWQLFTLLHSITRVANSSFLSDL